MENFKIHIDIINFCDDKTNYLYSDVIDKDVPEYDDNVKKIKRQVLNSYVGTLIRFFNLSSILLPEIIPEEMFRNIENRINANTKLFTSVLRSNWLNMLYSLNLIDSLLLNAESDYFLEFEGLAQTYKERQRLFKGYELLNTETYFKELEESIIGYITADDIVKYLLNRETIRNNKMLGISNFFKFMPGMEERLNGTNFLFLNQAIDYQSKYNLLNNQSKLYKSISIIFESMWNRLKKLISDHIYYRDLIEKQEFQSYNIIYKGLGIENDKLSKEETFELINFNILLFSSLYNIIDYFLYQINKISNHAFDRSKMAQLKLREEQKGKSEMMDYDDNKLNGTLTKEEFEKMMGKSVDELEQERREQNKFEEDDDEGYEDEK